MSLLASSGAGALRLGAEVLGVLMLAALVGVGLQAGARRWRRPSTLRELLLEDAAWLARHGYPPRPGESPAAHLREFYPVAGRPGVYFRIAHQRAAAPGWTAS